MPDTPPRPKHLRAHQLHADGSPTREPVESYPIDPETGQPFAGEGGRPGVGVVLMPIATAEYRALIRAATVYKADPDTGRLGEVIDEAAITDAVLTQCVRDWWGFEAADGSPLPCTPAIRILVFDPMMRAEIRWRATRTLTPVAAEVAGVRAASFREPAELRAVDARLGGDGALLPAGDAGGTGDGAV